MNGDIYNTILYIYKCIDLEQIIANDKSNYNYTIFLNFPDVMLQIVTIKMYIAHYYNIQQQTNSFTYEGNLKFPNTPLLKLL